MASTPHRPSMPSARLATPVPPLQRPSSPTRYSYRPDPDLDPDQGPEASSHILTVDPAGRDHERCSVGPDLIYLRQSIDGIDAKVNHLGKSTDQLENNVKRALQYSSEAKQLASEVKQHVDSTFLGFQSHIANVSATLNTHGKSISDVIDKLESTSKSLTDSLNILTTAEIKRAEREAIMTEMQKESRNWIRFAIPVIITGLSIFAGVIVWIMSHHK